jgi:O-antigen/teichoic acid export membrane protein
MLSSLLSATAGFFFWIVAAALFQPHDIGLATVVISSITLIVVFSRAGQDWSIIRFFPEMNKSAILGTSVVVTTILALAFGGVFVLLADVLSPSLQIIRQPLSAISFLAIVVTWSILMTLTTAFVANRRADYQFLQGIAMASRIPLLLLMTMLGALGIVGAFGIGYGLTLLLSIVLLSRLRIKLEFALDLNYLRQSFNYSATNFIVNLFMQVPPLMIPVLVLQRLGPESVAFFYISYTVASILYVIPNAISTSMLVEGSHGEAMKGIVRKSLELEYAILIPASFLIYLKGGAILSLFGTEYSSEGLELLRMMTVASLLIACQYTYFSIKRIQKKMKQVVLITGLVFSLTIVFSYFFISSVGITGVGYAWLLANSAGAASILAFSCWEHPEIPRRFRMWKTSNR